MNIKPKQWHHAAVVIDRSAVDASKIYIDGLEVPVERGTLPQLEVIFNPKHFQGLSCVFWGVRDKSAAGLERLALGTRR